MYVVYTGNKSTRGANLHQVILSGKHYHYSLYWNELQIPQWWECRWKVPAFASWHGSALEENGLMLVRQPAPRKHIISICWELIELSATLSAKLMFSFSQW